MNEEKEIWKRIESDEGVLLRFSNFGNYERFDGEKFVPQEPYWDKCNGYFAIRDNVLMRTTPPLHMIIALLFCKNTDRTHKTIVDHIDGDKLNNKANNLEWVTQKENVRRARLKNRIQQYSKYKCVETNQIYDSIKDISRQTGIRYYTLQTIIRSGDSVKGMSFEAIP